jgi:5-methylthioadenosine/S-adenosylhomocysteine deaminase
MKGTLLKVGALVYNARNVHAGPGYILMQNGVIAALGSGDYPGTTDGLDVICRPHGVAMPGLINSHGHAAMTLLRGAGDDMPLMSWLNDRIFPLEAKLTGETIYWGTMLAAWEMIRSGTTCFTDMYMYMDHAARAVEDAGLRAVLSWGLVGLDPEAGRRGIANTRSFAAAWHGAASGRITVTLGPHAPYTCPPDYLREVAELSAELDLPIQIHVSETRTEVEECVRQYGKTPVAHLRDCGLFERPLLAAHCVHVNADDIAILRAHDVRVAHNPQSNLKLASGIAPIVELTRAGITVGLGTDGAASNNNLDMFEEMRLAATLHKGVTGDATVIPASEAFAMATTGSARAVFLPEGHGELRVGAPADVVLLDLDSPHFLPMYDLLSNIVYAAGADDVTDVFVAGRPLLINREAISIDVERLRAEVQRISGRLQVTAPV